MGKVNVQLSVGNVPTWEELKRFTSVALSAIGQQINGNLTFSDNLNVRFIDVTFPSANIVTAIPHNLGRVPIMWLSGNVDASAIVFEGQSADNTNVYLEASAACSARILVI